MTSAVVAQDLLDVSRETNDRLRRLVELLVKWNSAINLVSKASLPNVWQRHIVDSAQIFAARHPDARLWADLGSGGGFPGLVVAILGAEAQPDLQVILVEADQRKATFLRQAVHALGLSSKVIADRIEALDPIGADILSARALAPLDVLCGYAQRHLKANGLAIFPKGASYLPEVSAARKSWNFHLETRPSVTDPAAVILSVRDILHV